MKIDDLQEVGAREKLRGCLKSIINSLISACNEKLNQPLFKQALREILSKDPQELNDPDIKFLRARRSYLSNEQKLKYSGVLYFSRPALYHEIKTTIKFLSKFSKELIIGVIIAIVAFWLIKFSGW